MGARDVDGSLESFRAAGRTLFSLGLIRGAEGNLSVFDGATLVITRTGSELDALREPDLITGSLEDPLPGASSDLEVHRDAYRREGPGALVHAHPPGTVREGGGGPGHHGMYVFGPTLAGAAADLVRRVRMASSIEARGDGDP